MSQQTLHNSNKSKKNDGYGGAKPKHCNPAAQSIPTNRKRPHTEDKTVKEQTVPESSRQTERCKADHGCLPEGVPLDFAVGLLSNISYLQIKSNANKEIQSIRKQFSKCFTLIPTLSDDGEDMHGEETETECPLCLCIELLLHHVTQCTAHWNDCDQCYQLASVIKTHIQSCLINTMKIKSEVLEGNIDPCKIVICRNIRSKLQDHTIHVFEHFWKKQDVWDRIRSYLSAVFHAPEITHTESLLAFESLNSMSIMNEALIDLTQEYDQGSWLGGAQPPNPLKLADQFDGHSMESISRYSDQVHYGTVNALKELVLRWKEEGIPKHQGIILYEYQRMFQVEHGQYKIDNEWIELMELGKGMFGNCFMAVDVNTGIKFCVKKIPLKNFDPLEVTIWSDLDHDYIASVYGVIGINQDVCVLSQLGIGGTLNDMIRKHTKLTMRTALVYCRQMFEALSYLEKRRIIHEDLKADNVVIDQPSRRILLIDFGLSSIIGIDDDGVPAGRSPVGAQTHMSPEKASSEGYDFRSDVWANICTLFHMISGKLPWIGDNIEIGCLYYVIATRDPPLSSIPPKIQTLYPNVYHLIEAGWQRQASRPTAHQCLQLPALVDVASCNSSSMWSMTRESIRNEMTTGLHEANAPLPNLDVLHKTISTGKPSGQNTTFLSSRPGDYPGNTSSTLQSSSSTWTRMQQSEEQRKREKKMLMREEERKIFGVIPKLVDEQLSSLHSENMETNYDNELLREKLNDIDMYGGVEYTGLENNNTNLDRELMSTLMTDLDEPLEGQLVHFMSKDEREICKIRVRSSSFNWYHIVKWVMDQIHDFGVEGKYTITHNGKPLNLKHQPTSTSVDKDLYLKVVTGDSLVMGGDWYVHNKEYHHGTKKSAKIT